MKILIGTLLVIQMMIGGVYVGLESRPMHKTPLGVTTNLMGCDWRIDQLSNHFHLENPDHCRWEKSQVTVKFGWYGEDLGNDVVFIPFCDKYYLCDYFITLQEYHCGQTRTEECIQEGRCDSLSYRTVSCKKLFHSMEE